MKLLACTLLFVALLLEQSPLRISGGAPTRSGTYTVAFHTRLQVWWPIPSIAALVGVQLHYLAFVDDPVTGPHLTNGIRDLVR